MSLAWHGWPKTSLQRSQISWYCTWNHEALNPTRLHQTTVLLDLVQRQLFERSKAWDRLWPRDNLSMSGSYLQPVLVKKTRQSAGMVIEPFQHLYEKRWLDSICFGLEILDDLELIPVWFVILLSKYFIGEKLDWRGILPQRLADIENL